MTIQLRQICLVAQDIQQVVDDLRCVLGINSCYVDPGVKAFRSGEQPHACRPEFSRGRCANSRQHRRRALSATS